MAEFLRLYLLGIALAAPVGPAGLAVIGAGLHGGFRRAWLTGLGVTAADTTLLLVVFFGLSGLAGYLEVRAAIWAFGALVLVYLGVSSLRDAQRRLPELEKDAANPTGRRSPLLAGYLVNISNPLAIVFWAGIYGSLLGDRATGSSGSALLAGAEILAGILTWHTITSLLSHFGRRFLNPVLLRLVSGLAGAALIGFGLRFGWLAFQAVLQILKR